MREQAVRRIDGKPDDLVRVVGRDLLDVHASCGAHHEDRTLSLPVHDEADIALRGDLGRRDHEYLLHFESLDAHAEDLGRVVECLGGGRAPASRRLPCPGPRRAPAP